MLAQFWHCCARVSKSVLAQFHLVGLPLLNQQVSRAQNGSCGWYRVFKKEVKS